MIVLIKLSPPPPPPHQQQKKQRINFKIEKTKNIFAVGKRENNQIVSYNIEIVCWFNKSWVAEIERGKIR